MQTHTHEIYMQELSKARREELRRMANGLRPLVQVGKQGMTAAVVTSIDQALAANELVKVKFGAAKDERHDLADEVARQLDAALVTIIGNVAVFFRPRSPKGPRGSDAETA